MKKNTLIINPRPHLLKTVAEVSLNGKYYHVRFCEMDWGLEVGATISKVGDSYDEVDLRKAPKSLLQNVVKGVREQIQYWKKLDEDEERFEESVFR